jgi:pseudaminic acid cytidylyltransferase
MTHNCIAIIPARGGSKRIPRKNIKDFLGKPLIVYSIETALKSKLFDKVIVSTDDENIAKIAVKYGAEVPFVRPIELSDDFTGTNDVIQHTLEYLKSIGEDYDYYCTIYATAPLLQSKYLRQGFEALKDSDAVNAFAVTSMPFPIQRTFKIDENNRCLMFQKEHYKTRSQDLEVAYQDAGQFYWTKLNKESDKIMFGEDSIPIILPRHLVQDIDTLEDWERAESLYKQTNPNVFDKWNSLKQSIEDRKTIQFNQRDILFVSMGQNVGDEQYGKGDDFLRPVVVLKKFSKNLFLGIPLSSQIKEGFLFHTISFKGRKNCALLLQSKTFDSKRIKYKLARLGNNEFKALVTKFQKVVTPSQKEKGSD